MPLLGVDLTPGVIDRGRRVAPPQAVSNLQQDVIGDRASGQVYCWRKSGRFTLADANRVIAGAIEKACHTLDCGRPERLVLWPFSLNQEELHRLCSPANGRMDRTLY
jgi:hypothetical protein